MGRESALTWDLQVMTGISDGTIQMGQAEKTLDDMVVNRT